MPTFETRVGPNRPIELPGELCDRLRIEEGTRAEFFLTVDGQVHFHALTQTTSDFGGFLIDMRRPSLSIREMDDGIAEHMCEEEDRLRRQRDEDRRSEASRSAAERSVSTRTSWLDCSPRMIEGSTTRQSPLSMDSPPARRRS